MSEQLLWHSSTEGSRTASDLGAGVRIWVGYGSASGRRAHGGGGGGGNAGSAHRLVGLVDLAGWAMVLYTEWGGWR